MTKKLLRIYDDVWSFGQQYKKELEEVPEVKSKFRVELMDNDRFIKQLGILNKRRERARSASKWKPRIALDTCDFDDTDVLAIDIDLVDSSDPYLTGEQASYLVRCFSRCGVILGLSQYQKLDFDLTLGGQPGSFADINISASQVANSGLWENSWSGFRPWHWPNVPILARRLEERAVTIQRNPKSLIVQALGLAEVSKSLPQSAQVFLGKKLTEATFEEFVLNSGYGLRGKDKPLSGEMVARIAAARIGKWIERLLLPGQDVLIDAPHLVSRYPSLLKGQTSRREAWNKLTKPVSVDRLGIDFERIEEFRMKDEEWLTRPLWFFGRLSNHEKIREIHDPWKGGRTDYVFCEDASAFFRPKDCTRFVANVESPFVQRYIKRFEGIVYGPNVNLVG